MKNRTHLNLAVAKSSFFHFSKRFFSLCFLAYLAVVFSSCGSIGDDLKYLGQEGYGPMHRMMAKYMEGGLINQENFEITLQVYEESGSLIREAPLTINPVSNRVFLEENKKFKIPNNQTYNFLVLFNYRTQAEAPLLLLGYVAKTEFVEGSRFELSWVASEIILIDSAVPPEISTSFSVGLPSLDSDGDGFSNLAELLDGSDPRDPASVPAPPVLVSQAVTQVEDLIRVELVVEDPSGISLVRPVNPVCGFLELGALEDQGNGQFKWTGVFNTHTVRYKDSLNKQDPDVVNAGEGISQALEFQVLDGLSQGATYTVVANNIVKNANPGDYNGQNLLNPMVAILEPVPGQTVGVDMSIHALGCDENGITTFSIVDLDPNAFGVTPLTLKGDEGYSDGMLELSTPSFDPPFGDLVSFRTGLRSEVLGEGPQTLGIEALDASAALNPGVDSVNIVVDTQEIIKVLTPAPNSIVQDVLNVVAVYTGEVPLQAFFVESITNAAGVDIIAFSNLLLDTIDELYTVGAQMVQFDDIEDLTLYINFYAVDVDGVQYRRSFPLQVSNRPKILEYGVANEGSLACLDGGVVELDWLVSNVDYVNIVEVLGTNFNGPLAENHSVSISCGPRRTLLATRDGTNFFGNLVKYTSEEVINLAPVEVNLTGVTQSNIPWGLVTGNGETELVNLADPMQAATERPGVSFRIGDPGTYFDEEGIEQDVLVNAVNLRGEILVGCRDSSGVITSANTFWQDFSNVSLTPPAVGDPYGNEVIIDIQDPGAPTDYAIEPRRDCQVMRVELHNDSGEVTSRINLMDIPAGISVDETAVDVVDSYAYNFTTTDDGLVAWYRFMEAGEQTIRNWSLYPLLLDPNNGSVSNFNLTASDPDILTLFGGDVVASFVDASDILEGYVDPVSLPDVPDTTDIHGNSELSVELVLNVDNTPWPETKSQENLPTESQLDCRQRITGTYQDLLDSMLCTPASLNCPCEENLDGTCPCPTESETCTRNTTYACTCSGIDADTEVLNGCNGCDPGDLGMGISHEECWAPTAGNVDTGTRTFPGESSAPFILAKNGEFAIGIVPEVLPVTLDVANDSLSYVWQTTLGMTTGCDFSPLMNADDPVDFNDPGFPTYLKNDPDNVQQSATIVNTGSLSHFVMVLQPDGPFSNLLHYINNQAELVVNDIAGSLNNSCNTSLTFNTLSITPPDLLLDPHHYLGNIREATIYDRALSDQEVNRFCDRSGATCN